MLLYELNISLLEQEKRFDKLEADLSDHIDVLQTDVKEVHLGVVRLIVNKTKRLLKDLKSNIKGKATLLDMGEKNDKYIGQLENLRKKLVDFRDKYKDNEFEKQIMKEVDTILTNLIGDIDATTAEAKKKIDALVKSIAKETSEEVQTKRIGKKVPVGLAQDLKTKKLGVAKNK